LPGAVEPRNHLLSDSAIAADASGAPGQTECLLLTEMDSRIRP